MADVERMSLEEVQQYFVKKYKAKNWDDFVNNAQTTNVDKEDREVIKTINKKIEDMRIISSKAQTLELVPAEENTLRVPAKKNKLRMHHAK